MWASSRASEPGVGAGRRRRPLTWASTCVGEYDCTALLYPAGCIAVCGAVRPARWDGVGLCRNERTLAGLWEPHHMPAMHAHAAVVLPVWDSCFIRRRARGALQPAVGQLCVLYTAVH
jgi:hypothetical protein